MPLMRASNALLVLIDFQVRLMPAIDDGARLCANAGRLVAAARLLDIAVLTTEQSPDKLGGTVPELAEAGQVLAGQVLAGSIISKTSFDACAEPAFLDAIAGDRELVICGCEAHVCVAQTVLSLLEHRRRVLVVRDAVGSRAAESKHAALARMERDGAEIVTTEMVLFEWLRNAAHPQFRTVSKLIR